MTQTKPLPAKPLYQGATSCDFRVELALADGVALMLGNAAVDAEVDDLLPWHALADRLEEIGDARAESVRQGCRWWEMARAVRPGRKKWDRDKCQAALTAHNQDVASWRFICAWGCLLAYHAPAANGCRMGETWVDVRVRASWRGVWCWCLGLCEESQAYAAWRQADAAWSQADAAGRQADAAWSQADAAGSQADAAWRQADAAWSQADAAGSQADAAGSQADAAGSQAYAAGSQADAAWRQADAAGRQAYAAGRQAKVWRYARALWERMLSATSEEENP